MAFAHRIDRASITPYAVVQHPLVWTQARVNLGFARRITSLLRTPHSQGFYLGIYPLLLSHTYSRIGGGTIVTQQHPRSDHTHPDTPAEILLDIITTSYGVHDRADFQGLFNRLRVFSPFEYIWCGLVSLQCGDVEMLHRDYPPEMLPQDLPRFVTTDPLLIALRQTKQRLVTSLDIQQDYDSGRSLEGAHHGLANRLGIAFRGQSDLCLYIAVANVPLGTHETLLAGLRSLAAPLYCCGMNLTGTLLLERAELHRLVQRLSIQEVRILKGLFAGQSNYEIARQVGMTEPMVRFHLQQATAKSGTFPIHWSASLRHLILTAEEPGATLH